MVRIDENRLWDRLMEIAQIGGTPKGGVCRVTLTEEDKKGRELFISWCKSIGCTVRIDNMGNIFAKYPGGDNSLPSILIGSHLDSQPTGGKYDGVLGVLSALEVCETLHEKQIVTDRPIEIVSWTNEEGARFSPAMIGSGVFAGEFTLDYAYQREDKEGLTLGGELEKIGHKGSDIIDPSEFYASLELHIEQGPILEKEEKKIGVVTGVQGIRWYEIQIDGKECHAGPTPMSYRTDPVMVLPKLINKLYEIGEKYAPDSRITIGSIRTKPGVTNTVPGSINLTLDIRNPEQSILDEMHLEAQTVVRECDQDSKASVTLQEVWHSPSVRFASQCIDAVQAAAEASDYSHRKLVSGAGHDSVYISKVIPTSMIFIPCKDGLSHNELESIEKEDAIAGTNVLLNAVLNIK